MQYYKISVVSSLSVVIFLFLVIGRQPQRSTEQKILPGAAQLDAYLSKLQGKETGLFVNHTSLVEKTHLTDTLLSLNVKIKRVFSPEHGFKGNKADGEKIVNETSSRFELVSLYGKSRKPTNEQIRDLDLLIVDIQDVGVRFYTYASTMTYLMEACARNNVLVLILDRPNPNGSYIDGPVLDEKFESFLGLHPIPLVHGLTLGELALMINGEGWLEDKVRCDLETVPVANWDHKVPYHITISPSPNLPNDKAISLYPSLALFEQTIVSVGRGTGHQFQVIGHPAYTDGTYSFIPMPNEGSKYPPLEGKKCLGIDLSDEPVKYEFTLRYLIRFYEALNGKTEKSFFRDHFEKLAGNDRLQKQIEAGWTEEKIKESWQKDLEAYRRLREKYLLYAD